MMQHCRILLPLLLLAVSAGCLQPYDLEVQQGNVVTEEMISQLERGMTQRQVRFVLGSPLITDPFQPNRWDYYYWREAHDSNGPEQRRITLFFDDDGHLQRMAGDVIAIGAQAPPAGAQAGVPDSAGADEGAGQEGGTMTQVAEGSANGVGDDAQAPAEDSPGFLKRWWHGIWE